MNTADTEFVDDVAGLIIRRVVVGALDTNCWIVADVASGHAIVIDPGDEADRLIDATSDLVVDAVVLTHSHWDHVLALPTVADAWGCDVLQHPDDAPVWPHELNHLSAHRHFDAGTATADLLACGCTLAPKPDIPMWTGRTEPVHHGQTIPLATDGIRVLHTPGHTPGGISLLVADHVFTGDTLFPGGPGLTGWPLSDFDTIIQSIEHRLFTLPGSVAVHPGHGRSTTIETERPHLSQWVTRGW